MTRSVVFDFGAVLFQWQPYRLLQECLPELAPDEDSARRVAAQIFESFTPDSDWARFDLGRIAEAELAERIAARIGVQPAQVRRVIDAIPPHLQPQSATVALLKHLKAAGHRLYYLSNMPHPYADHLDRTHGFLRLFTGGVYSGRVLQIKPERAIYDLAAQRFGVPPGGLLFFDDVVANVAAAQAAGWQAAHFTDAAAARALLLAQGFALGR